MKIRLRKPSALDIVSAILLFPVGIFILQLVPEPKTSTGFKVTYGFVFLIGVTIFLISQRMKKQERREEERIKDLINSIGVEE